MEHATEEFTGGDRFAIIYYKQNTLYKSVQRGGMGILPIHQIPDEYIHKGTKK